MKIAGLLLSKIASLVDKFKTTIFRIIKSYCEYGYLEFLKKFGRLQKLKDSDTRIFMVELKNNQCAPFCKTSY